LVGFAVTLNQRTDTGWQHVVRIDTAHGEVHMHRYLRNGDEERTVFEVITPDRAGKIMERWYSRAAVMMEYEWRGYLKEWTDEVD